MKSPTVKGFNSVQSPLVLSRLIRLLCQGPPFYPELQSAFCEELLGTPDSLLSSWLPWASKVILLHKRSSSCNIRSKNYLAQANRNTMEEKLSNQWINAKVLLHGKLLL